MLRHLYHLATTPDSPVRQLRRALALSLLLFFVAISLIAGWWFREYRRARAALDAEIAHIRARGEPVEWLEVRETYSQPNARNADLELLLERAARLDILDINVGTYLDHVGDPPIDEFRATAQKHAEIYPLIARAIEGAPYGWQSRYETTDVLGVQLPQALHMRIPHILLWIDATLALAESDSERACQRINESFMLSGAFCEDSFTTTLLYRIACSDVTLDLLQQVLPTIPADDECLDKLDIRLGELAHNVDLSRVVQGERAVFYTLLGQMGSDRTYYLVDDFGRPAPYPNEPFTRFFDPAVRRNYWWGAWYARPWLLRERAFWLRCCRELSPHYDRPYHVAFRSLQQTTDLHQKQLVDHPLIERIYPSYWTVHGWRSANRFLQRVLLARIAIRLHQYRATHGELPHLLDAIVDDELPAIPNGLLSGAPPRYERLDDGFVLTDPWPAGDTSHQVGPAQFEVHYDTPPPTGD